MFFGILVDCYFLVRLFFIIEIVRKIICLGFFFIDLKNEKIFYGCNNLVFIKMKLYVLCLV